MPHPRPSGKPPDYGALGSRLGAATLTSPWVARAPRNARASWTTQANHTAVLSSNLLNEVRVAYLHADPVTLWEPQELSTTYTRSGSVPFTIGVRSLRKSVSASGIG